MNNVASERPEFELSAPAVRNSVGEQLRAARINAGLTVESVAKQLKLAPRQVTAIENDDVATLPSGPFLRGFVRNYARLVGLDSEALLGHNGSRRSAAPPLDAAPPSRGEIRESAVGGNGRMLRWVIPALLIGLILAGLTWNESRKTKTPAITMGTSVQPQLQTPAAETSRQAASNVPTPSVLAESTQPATNSAPGAPVVPSAQIVSPPNVNPASAPAASASPAAAILAPASTTAPVNPVAAPATATFGPRPVALELSFGAQSWTEIRDGAGNVLTAKTQPKGSRLTVSGQPPFRFTIGEARAVVLTRDGATVDLAPRIGAGDVAKFTLE